MLLHCALREHERQCRRHRERRAAPPRGGAAPAPQRLPPPGPGPDRHTRRVRARCLWSVHDPVRRPARACIMLAVQADGHDIRTVESLASPDGELNPLQAAFKSAHGLQCGFCTPGMLMTLTAFLRDNPNPDESQIRD